MTPIIEVKALTKHFGGLRALEEVSFKVREGSIVSIIGPNGAGKTTLFNCLTGLTRPTGGHIYLKDREITGLPSHEIVRYGIARTFQNIRVFKEMTVLENVMVGEHIHIKTGLLSAIMRGKGFRSKEQEAADLAMEYLGFVGLEDRAHTAAFNLSYGDQKRLEIARALATKPSILLLDEPTAGMNPQETSAVMELILRLQKIGKTIILIEHDMKVVMGISEMIVVLDHGVKIAEGTPDVVRTDPLVIEAYLGRGSLVEAH